MSGRCERVHTFHGASSCPIPARCAPSYGEMGDTRLIAQRLVQLLVAWSFALPAWAAAPSPPSEARAEPHVQVQERSAGLAKAVAMRASHAHAIHLAAPPPGATDREIGPPKKGVPLKIGFGRDVPGLATEGDTASALAWERLADGSLVAAVTLTSDTAAAVRAGLRVARLPADARVRFQAPGAAESFEATGREIADAIARNAAAGETGPDARTYWSPLIEGPSITVEIELTAGTDPSTVSIAVPRLSHLVTSP